MNRCIDMNTDREELVRLYPKLRVDDDWTPRTYVRPTEKSLILYPDHDVIRASAAAFGLIPAWKEDRKTHFENARSESVWEKPTFRGLVPDVRHRCLVPVTGYWEWDARNVRHLIRPRDGTPWLLAGLHHTWTHQHESVWCFTFLTLDAPDYILPVHDRVPVVLTREEAFDVWLSPQAGQADLKALVHTSPEADTIIEERPSQPIQERLF